MLLEFQWSYENWYFQIDKPLRLIETETATQPEFLLLLLQSSSLTSFLQNNMWLHKKWTQRNPSLLCWRMAGVSIMFQNANHKIRQSTSVTWAYPKQQSNIYSCLLVLIFSVGNFLSSRQSTESKKRRMSQIVVLFVDFELCTVHNVFWKENHKSFAHFIIFPW